VTRNHDDSRKSQHTTDISHDDRYYRRYDNIGPSLPLTVTTTGHKFIARTGTTNIWRKLHGPWRRYTVTRVWRPLPEELPRIIRKYLYFYRNYNDRPTFCSMNIGLSSLKFFWWAHKFCLFLQEWRFSRSRSSRVIDVGTNRKRICDFLLVRNSNLGPILHRFGDFAAFMCSWPHPYSIP